MQNHEPETENLATILADLWRRKWLIGGLTALAMAVALGVSLTTQETFETKGTLLITNSSGGSFGSSLAGLMAGAPMLGQFFGGGGQSISGVNLKAILESQKLARKVYSHDDIYKAFAEIAEDPDYDLEKLVRSALDRIEVEDATSGVVTITVRAPTSELVKKVTDAYLDELIDFVRNQMKTTSRMTYDFVEQQLKLTEDKLAQSELDQKAYEEKEGVFSIEGQTQKMISNYAELERKMMESRIALASADRRIRELQATERNKPEPYQAPNPELVSLRQQLIEKEVEFQKIKGIIDPNNMTYISLQEEIGTLKKQLAIEMDKVNLSEMENLQIEKAVHTAAIDLIQSNLKEMDGELEGLPETKLDYLRLVREFEIQTAIYKMLRQQLETSKIEMARDELPIEVLDYGEEPEFRIKPIIRLNMLVAGFVAGLLSCMCIYLSDYLRRLSGGAPSPQ